MTRDRESYLYDILESCRFLAEFTKNESVDRYRDDRVFRRVVEREFQIIGKALVQLKKLDPDTVARISESERIIGFRHLLVHAYFDLDEAVVWGMLENKIRPLADEVDARLKDTGTSRPDE